MEAEYQMAEWAKTGLAVGTAKRIANIRIRLISAAASFFLLRL
jgi:hypothetical protein